MSNLNLPDGWKQCKIEEIANIYVGRDLKEESYSKTKTEKHTYPVYSNSVDNYGLYGYYDFEEYPSNCLTVVGRGVGLGTAFPRDKGFGAIGRLLVVSPKEKAFNAKYLSEYINTRLTIYNESSGIPQLPGASFAKYKVILPTYDEQVFIADLLEQWDTAIEKTEALIDAKERQFGWLKSKLLLRNPNAKHWKTETLGHYIEEKKDKSTVPDLHPCLTSSRRGMFLQDEYFSKQVASKDNTGYKIMSRGDFTYRSMSDDGTFVFNKQDIVDKGLISPAYGVFAPNKHMDADFLYYFLNSSAFKRALAGEVQGGTRTALKLNALKKLDVDIPELPEQKAIANKLNTAKHEIDLLIKLADQYRTQKRGLMQKLLSHTADEVFTIRWNLI